MNMQKGIKKPFVFRLKCSFLRAVLNLFNAMLRNLLELAQKSTMHCNEISIMDTIFIHFTF